LGSKGEAQAVVREAPTWSQFQHGSLELGSELLPTILEALPIGIFIATAQGTAFQCNRMAATLLGRRITSGLPLASFAQRHAIYRAGSGELYPTELLPILRATRGEACAATDLELQRPAGALRLTMQAAPVCDRAGRVIFAVATLVEQPLPALPSSPPPYAESSVPGSGVRAARNLETIGELAAGVAHEINTPMQYIGDNTAFLGVTVRRLLDLAASFERLVKACSGGQAPSPEVVSECERELTQRRLHYLREQAPLAIEQTQSGIDQVRAIVQALKEFSHPGEDEPVLVDINRLVNMATTVTRNAWRYVAELNLELAEDLQPVRGYPQELGQVLINLIVNAAHALEERAETNERHPGTITIRTRSCGDHVEIDVADDGTGIPDAVRDRIMSPFFTTKPVGKGTGQGLPLARKVIVERHQGRLSFESKVGLGTTFTIVLPGAPP
jgi:signal transduction histidine kinase